MIFLFWLILLQKQFLRFPPLKNRFKRHLKYCCPVSTIKDCYTKILNMSNQSKNDNNSVLELFEHKRMIKHLRIVLFAYLKNCEDVPIDFAELLCDMNLLFEFLEEQYPA